MEENLGTMMVDGKLIDLDKLSVEELKQIQANLYKKEKEIRNRIDEILKSGEI